MSTYNEDRINRLKEILFFTQKLLTKHGIFHWLDFGSLLGAVREQQIISWDSDIDFSILKEDVKKVLSLEEEITKAGYYLNKESLHHLHVIQILSHQNGKGVDLFPWWKEEKIMKFDWLEAEKWYFPAHYLNNLQPVVLYNQEFPAPTPVHDFLEKHRYGPNYMTPVQTDGYGQFGPDDLTDLACQLFSEIWMLDHRIEQLECRLPNNDQEQSSLSKHETAQKPTQSSFLRWYYSNAYLAGLVRTSYRKLWRASMRLYWFAVFCRLRGQTEVNIKLSDFNLVVTRLLLVIHERRQRYQQLVERIGDDK